MIGATTSLGGRQVGAAVAPQGRPDQGRPSQLGKGDIQHLSQQLWRPGGSFQLCTILDLKGFRTLQRIYELYKTEDKESLKDLNRSTVNLRIQDLEKQLANVLSTRDGFNYSTKDLVKVIRYALWDAYRTDPRVPDGYVSMTRDISPEIGKRQSMVQSLAVSLLGLRKSELKEILNNINKQVLEMAFHEGDLKSQMKALSESTTVDAADRVYRDVSDEDKGRESVQFFYVLVKKCMIPLFEQMATKYSVVLSDRERSFFKEVIGQALYYLHLPGRTIEALGTNIGVRVCVNEDQDDFNLRNVFVTYNGKQYHPCIYGLNYDGGVDAKACRLQHKFEAFDQLLQDRSVLKHLNIDDFNAAIIDCFTTHDSDGEHRSIEQIFKDKIDELKKALDGPSELSNDQAVKHLSTMVGLQLALMVMGDEGCLDSDFTDRIAEFSEPHISCHVGNFDPRGSTLQLLAHLKKVPIGIDQTHFKNIYQLLFLLQPFQIQLIDHSLTFDRSLDHSLSKARDIASGGQLFHQILGMGGAGITSALTAKYMHDRGVSLLDPLATVSIGMPFIRLGIKHVGADFFPEPNDGRFDSSVIYSIQQSVLMYSLLLPTVALQGGHFDLNSLISSHQIGEAFSSGVQAVSNVALAGQERRAIYLREAVKNGLSAAFWVLSMVSVDDFERPPKGEYLESEPPCLPTGHNVVSRVFSSVLAQLYTPDTGTDLIPAGYHAKDSQACDATGKDALNYLRMVITSLMLIQMVFGHYISSRRRSWG